MLASDVISACATDMRGTLDATNDATKILGWVDRIQKDVLHTTLYNALMKNMVTVSTTSGTSSYTLTLSVPVRRIQLVFDRTFNKELLPTSMVSKPAETGQEELPNQPPSVWTNMSEETSRPKSLLNLKTQTLWPEYYRFLGPSTFIVFPAPANSSFTSTLEIYYEGVVTTVASTGATLTVPDDSKDMMVAGVDMLAATYLKRPDEAATWAQIYRELKTGSMTI